MRQEEHPLNHRTRSLSREEQEAQTAVQENHFHPYRETDTDNRGENRQEEIFPTPQIRHLLQQDLNISQ